MKTATVFVGSLHDNLRKNPLGGVKRVPTAFHAVKNCQYLQVSNPGGFGVLEFDEIEARKRFTPCRACVGIWQ